ncbi:MAG: 2-oxo acid dehydrogenase subunit E2, partial [Oscillospiraceae bacterium]|nr:2-oxo acid dehydrogenase subunit E2 [Oscillospiraceae bacterium]
APAPAPAAAGAVPPAGNAFTPISPRARTLAAKAGANVAFATPSGANNRIMEKDIQKVIADGHFATKAVDGAFSGIAGTGLGGRVTTFDVESGLSAPSFGASASAIPSAPGVPNTPDSEVQKLSNVRKVIAKAMHSSLSGSAQLTHHGSFDATDILNFRKNLKAMETRPELAKITVTDIIIYATSRILLKHKSLNAHFLGDSMALFNNVHMGLAVDTPRGLLVPTIFNANVMSLSQISAATKVKVESSRKQQAGFHRP